MKLRILAVLALSLVWAGATAAGASGAVVGIERTGANSPSNSQNKAVTVSCPAGKKVLSASADVNPGNGDVLIDDVRPSADLQSVTANALEDETGTAANWTVTALATCAYPPPGLERVTATSPLNSTNKSVTATCPSGKRVLGVGADLNTFVGQVLLDDLRPDSGLTNVTVNALEDETGNSTNWSATAYAVCANADSGTHAGLEHQPARFQREPGRHRALSGGQAAHRRRRRHQHLQRPGRARRRVLQSRGHRRRLRRLRGRHGKSESMEPHLLRDLREQRPAGGGQGRGPQPLRCRVSRGPAPDGRRGGSERRLRPRGPGADAVHADGLGRPAACSRGRGRGRSAALVRPRLPDLRHPAAGPGARGGVLQPADVRESAGELSGGQAAARHRRGTRDRRPREPDRRRARPPLRPHGHDHDGGRKRTLWRCSLGHSPVRHRPARPPARAGHERGDRPTRSSSRPSP